MRSSAVAVTRDATSSATADQVLAVVEHEQVGDCPSSLGDARPDVGALLGSANPAATDRIADAEHGADLADDVLRRGDADELDDVHDRYGGVAREDMGEARLSEAAGADDETTRDAAISALSRSRSCSRPTSVLASYRTPLRTGWSSASRC